jgi:hypothetical protein
VSVEEKVPPDGISCESERRAQANHPMRCRKLKDDVKTGGYLYTRISLGDSSLDYRPPAPESIMPLHFDPFWLSSSQENIAQILT